VNRALHLLGILVCGMTLVSAAFGQPVVNEAPVVVMLDRGASGFVYKVNSRVVSKELLLTLSKMRRARRDDDGTLLVHEDAPLATVINALGVMQKAGYEHPRVFYFDRNKRGMSELTFSAGVPFSPTGQLATPQPTAGE